MDRYYRIVLYVLICHFSFSSFANAVLTEKFAFLLDDMQGRPVETDIAMGDVNGDGRDDIVVGCRNGSVYCISGNGNYLWVVSTGDAVMSPPAIGDLDGDRRNEVIVGSDDGNIYCISSSGSVRWTKTTNGPVRSGACIVDLNGDTINDVVIGSDDGYLYGLDGSGYDLSGWPYNIGAAIESTPAAYDVDFDDLPEVAVGADDGNMWLLDNDGSVVPGWPVETRYYIRSSPAIGDIDNDGSPEIVAGSDDFNVYAWKPTGALCSGWPVTTGYKISKASPALVDIDGDKQLDVIIGSGDNFLYAWDGDGNDIPGFPIETYGRLYNSSPAVADIDGDMVYDIVLGGEDANIYMFSATGNELPDSPLMTMGAIHTSPALGDIDGDGQLEMAIGTQAGDLLVYDTNGSASAARTSAWKQFHHDRWKSGVYGYLGGATVIPSCEMKSVEGIELSGDVSFEYRLEDPQGGSMNIRGEYSQDWGHTWDEATIIGSTSGLRGGWHSITWQSEYDLISPDERDGLLASEDKPDAWREYREQKDVIFRIVPENALSTGKAAESGLVWVDNNKPPSVSLNQITEEQSEEVYFDYTINDEEHDLIALECSYSLDGGTTWEEASVEGATTDIRAGRYESSVTWMSDSDIDQVDSENVAFKIVPGDNDPGLEGSLTALHVDNNYLPESYMVDIEEEKIGDFPVAYKLEDRESDTLSLVCEFSLDNGETWAPATVSGATQGITGLGYESEITWESRGDTMGEDVLTAQFRITPVDKDEGKADATGSFHLDNNDSPTLAITPIVGEQVGPVEIAYSLEDPENDTISITAEYYDVDDSEWKIATTTGTTNDIDAAYYDGSIVWDSLVDMLGHDNKQTQFRITAADNDLGEPIEADPFFVDNNSEPGALLADLGAEQSGDVTINYTLSDLERDTVSFVCEYSGDGGDSWSPASVSGTRDGLGTGDYIGEVTWHSVQDIPNLHIENARFRVIPSDEDEGKPGATSNFIVDNNNPPTVTIARLDGEQTNEISVSYDLLDDEGDAVAIMMDFSEDGGQTWIPATVEGSEEGIRPGRNSITWLSANDVPGVDKDDLMVRIIAEDMDIGDPGELGGIHVDNSYPPSVTLTSLEGEQTGDIVIEYTIQDSENDVINITPEFSEDGGMSWWPASVDGITDDIYSSGYLGSLVWRSDTDLPGTDQSDIAFRITPSDNDVGELGVTDNFHLDNNELPTISLETPEVEQSGSVTISYSLEDPESDASEMTVEYSADGGFTWKEASVATATTLDPTRYAGTFTWVSDQDLPNADRDDIMVRVTPLDNDEGLSDVTGVFHLDNNEPPSVEIPPLTGEISGDVKVAYSAFDDEGSELDLVVEYSADRGASWTEATVSGEVGSIGRDFYSNSFIWSTYADLPGVDTDSIALRVTPADNDRGEPYTVENIHIDNNDPPVVMLNDLYEEQGGEVLIEYSVSDTEDDTVDLKPVYSIDGGSTWDTPTVSGNVSGIGKTDYIGGLTWNAAADIKGIDSDNTVFRIVPSDSDVGAFGETAMFRIDTNDPPRVDVIPPGDIGGDEVEITYVIDDPEGDSVNLIAEYSSDGGFTWEEATVGGATTGIGGGGYRGSFSWNAGEDIAGLDSSDIQIRISASDNDVGEFGASPKFHVDVNDPPTVTIQPVPGEQGDEVTMEFNLDDIEGDPLSVEPEYSLDGGATWRPATVRGNTSDIGSLMYSATFNWEARNDVGSIDNESVLFRITPMDNNAGTIGTSETFHVDTNRPPSVDIDVSATDIEGDVVVPYSVTDEEGDPVTLNVEYSVDGGFTFLEASTDRSLSGLSRSSYSGSFTWLATSDASGEDVTNATVRITPSDNDEGETAMSIPFRVDNNHLPSAEITLISDIIQEGETEVSYRLSDDEGDALSITPEYSLDGVTWNPATTFGITSDIRPETYTGTLVWAVESDIPGREMSGVYFRITPYDTQLGNVGTSLPVNVDTNYAPEVSVTDLFGEQESDTILIDYAVNDIEGDTVIANCEYSTDGGTSWRSATISGSTSLSTSDYFGSIEWEARRDLGVGYRGEVIFRITVSDSNPGASEQTTPFTIDFNTPPAVTLTAYREVASGDIKVDYTFSDAESDQLDFDCYYSEDGGISWNPATLTEWGIISSTEYSGTFTWERMKDIPSVLPNSSIFFRVTPSDDDEGEPGDIAIPLEPIEAPEIPEPEEEDGE
ncbi:MAG: PQQ-binding-like beta-propeller repeat protein [bacterium]|nr:PQQ-binding-like beta-propeller repeat protein [bacterium]